MLARLRAPGPRRRRACPDGHHAQLTTEVRKTIIRNDQQTGLRRQRKACAMDSEMSDEDTATSGRDELAAHEHELMSSLVAIEASASDIIVGHHRAAIEDLLGQAFWRWQPTTELARRHAELATWFSALLGQAYSARQALLHLLSPVRQRIDSTAHERALLAEIKNHFEETGHCLKGILEWAGIEARRLHEKIGSAGYTGNTAPWRTLQVCERARTTNLPISFADFTYALDDAIDPERSRLRDAAVEARKFDLDWAAAINAELMTYAFSLLGLRDHVRVQPKVSSGRWLLGLGPEPELQRCPAGSAEGRAVSRPTSKP
jgi:hypothetical protein